MGGAAGTGIARDYSSSTASPVCFDLAFSYRSQSRGGGVLDLKPRLGQLVSGILFEVPCQGLAALDRKEGAPNVYHRVPITAIDHKGQLVTAFTYRVRENLRRQYVRPTKDYLAVVRRGLEHWGLDDDHLSTVADNREVACPDGFFFYGTLLRGEQRFSALRRFGIDCVLLAETCGRLLNLGTFPGLVDVGASESLVQGEFVRLRRPEAAIRELDVIEGFLGFGKPGSLFRRTRIDVHVGDGRVRPAWTYSLNAHANQATAIASGDWREHLGCRQEFLKGLAQAHAGSDELVLARHLASCLPFSFNENREEMVSSLLPLREALSRGVLSERKLAQASGNWTAII